VQNAVLQTMRRLHVFQPESNKALAAYLRRAVLNQIRDEHRSLKRHGIVVELNDSLVAPVPSPFDETSLEETLRRYRAALATLRPKDQQLVVAHIELGYSHAQLGCMTVRTPNAARVALRRALERLTEHMLDG
jgi:RNA polymerase sigma factor (sigma-70 family)